MSGPPADPRPPSLSVHKPVLLREVIEWLDLRPGLTVADGTVGGGGHSVKILEHIGPTGTLIGLDRDESMLARAAGILSAPNCHLRQASYADLPRVQTRPDRYDDTRFAYASYRGSPIRLVAVVRRVPRVEAPVVVQVAETLDSRSGLWRRLLVGLLVLEVVLIVPLAVLVPIAVRWGLRPLAEVRQEIDNRSPIDFTPLTLNRAIWMLPSSLT